MRETGEYIKATEISEYSTNSRVKSDAETNKSWQVGAGNSQAESAL
jgi:hypothetical protein